MTAAPYFLTSGRTRARLFSSPETELTSTLPSAALRPRSSASGLDESRTSGNCGGSGHAENGPLHGRRLVDAGRAHIHIEQRRAGGCLLHGFAADVGDLSLPAARRQRPFLPVGLIRSPMMATGFPGPMADITAAAGKERHRSSAGPVVGNGSFMTGKGLSDRPDMGRSGAAAAADDPHPQLQHPLMIGGHLLRSAGEDGLAVLEYREPGIGLGDERQCG